MIFYHGTTLDAAKQIKREGLKKIPDKALQIQNLKDYPFVYLLPDRRNAALYARFRAEYEDYRRTTGAVFPRLPE